MGSILNTKRSVTISTGEEVEVKELRAVDGLEFLKVIASHLGAFKPDAQGNVKIQITELAVGVQEVSWFLLTKSCGKPKDWIEGLGVNDFLALLTEAIDLNVSDLTVKKVQGVVAKFASLKS